MKKISKPRQTGLTEYVVKSVLKDIADNMFKQNNNMKIYYARPINLYNSELERRDMVHLFRLGFEVINPNKEELQKRYKKEGMDVFLEAVKECDALAFRSFPDLSIGAGVQKEIDKAIELNIPVIELPTFTSKRMLSVEDTRAYLQYLGFR